MIRHFDGSNAGGLWAQAQRGRIYAVVWTLGKHRIVKTKAEGNRVIKVWKDYHRKIGWTVKGNLAYPPDDATRALRAITLHEYDAESRERVA